MCNFSISYLWISPADDVVDDPTSSVNASVNNWKTAVRIILIANLIQICKIAQA